MVSADIGGRTIIFEAEDIEDSNGNPLWEITFFEKTKGGFGFTYKQTGSGKELEVFAFVGQALQEFLDRYGPDKVYFTADKDDDSQEKNTRADVYEKLLKRAKFKNYKVVRDTNSRYSKFELVRDH
jgi:hypothetical protein